MAEIKSMTGPTLWIRRDAMNEPDFMSGFTVLQNGLFLIDQNDDLWTLIDSDETHNRYKRDDRELGDLKPPAIN